MSDRFWVAGTGNYSDYTNHWASSSGGSPGASLPTSSDSAIFDTNSNGSAYTVTIDANSNCLDFTMGAPASGKVTWAGTKALSIYGNFSLSGGTAGITNAYSGTILLRASSGTKTFDTNGITLFSRIDLNASGATIQLSNNLSTSTGSAISVLSRTAGTFDPNGYTVTIRFGVSPSNIVGSWNFYNLTVGPNSGNTRITLDNNMTVTNTMTLSGNSSTNRLTVQSSVVGTQRTITAGAVSLTNVNFQDIVQAGAVIPWTGTSVRYIPSAEGLVVSDWNNPTNIYLNDGSYATAGTGSTVDQQDYYRHNIPTFTGYSIDGIEVFVEAKDSAASPTTWTMECRLSSDGGSTYTSAKSQTWSSTSDTVASFGGSADTWGRSWASSDLDTNNFLLDFDITGGGSGAEFSLDQVTVQIYVSGGTTTSTSTSSTSSSSSSSSSSTSSTSSSTSSTSSSSTSSTSSSTSSSSSSTSSTSSSSSSTSSTSSSTSSTSSSTSSTSSSSSTSSTSSSTSSTSSSTSSTSSSSSSTSSTSSSTSSTSSSTSSTSSSSSTSSTITSTSTSSTSTSSTSTSSTSSSSSTSSTSSSSSTSSTSSSTIMLKPIINAIQDQHPEFSESFYI